MVAHMTRGAYWVGCAVRWSFSAHARVYLYHTTTNEMTNEVTATAKNLLCACVDPLADDVIPAAAERTAQKLD